MISVEKINFGGWNNCLKISNGTIDAIATTEVGPRIISYGFADGTNELYVDQSTLGVRKLDSWSTFGGHRLWHSPEDPERTYHIDTDLVDYSIVDNGVILRQAIEQKTGIQKTIEVTMDENGALTVKHSMTNTNLWTVELSLWGITVMDAGGVQIMKNPNRATGLLPNRTISLWPYAKMNDSRITWGDRYLFLAHDKNCDGPFKIGFPNEHGWAAYFNNGNLYIKKHEHDMNAVYPDGNCSYETYTNESIMEMESLSPLYTIQPGETKTHFEKWELYRDVTVPNNEDEADQILASYIK